ncbi:sensor histidine kinase [Motilimonas pumila]|uniref:histidine kinase n=1 Tax=Motilimonas pumila TaxID=2303987 RepID=A0A418YCI5_9GAMM|nr:ATP-binding protein [Motilimonas pumila]RJG42185.1 HAMP domain-containing protein [Motilimonas pumila]
MKRHSIASSLYLILGGIALVILLFSTTVVYLGTQVNQASEKVIAHDMPAALNTLAMLEELGDMNSNMLEYVLGEKEEKHEYYSNLDEFHRFRRLIPENFVGNNTIEHLERIVDAYEEIARLRVFEVYNPIAESHAANEINQLLINVGRPLEKLLNEMKEEEIADIGTQEDLNEVISDDLPGIRFYLELVDEAGDMLADLDRFVLGDSNARRSFFENALQFETYLAQLKKIENKPEEIIKLREIKRLFIELKEGGTRIFDGYQARTKLQALEAIDDLEHQNFKDAEDLLDDISYQSRSEVDRAMLGLSELADQITWVIGIASLATLLFVISITVYTRRYIFRPINTITQTIDALRKGERNFEIPDSGRHDELSDVIVSLKQFQAELVELDQLRSKEQGMQKAITSEKEKAEEALEELQATQSKLIATEKMASLGALVAGVAHEVNTPIGVSVTISTTLARNFEHFLEKVKSGEIKLSDLDKFEADSLQSLQLLNNSLEQASHLIHNFKQVATDQTSSKRREFEVKETLEEILSTLQHKIKRSHISCKIEGCEHIVMDSYPGPFGQVITNLFNNAVLHGFEEQGEGLITIRFEQKSDQLKILFSDNGQGIPPENIGKVFDPFFTTKLGRGGSGLGLNIVHNIISGLLGGSVTVDSRLGTTFELMLPLIAPRSEADSE